jgi:crotonobetainyl-CoA:carnitine CoA-transferase CaiB-like acyl-CoA transferase
MGSAHPNIAPYGSVFFAEDGKPFVLAVGTDNQFASLCSILGVGALARDDRFTTNVLRVANRRALEIEIQDAARSWNLVDLLSRLAVAGVPAGAVRNLDSVFETDLARGMLLGDRNAPLSCAPGIRQIAFVGPPRRKLGPPPTLGQDTTRVLQEYCGAATRDLQAIGWTSRDQ